MDSPIGAALKNLSSVITRGPNEAQNILRAEAALKLKQQRENTVGAGDMLRRYGTPDFDRNAFADMSFRGGVTPANAGGYERYLSANTYGAADPRTDNAAVGAGEAYGSTAGGFREGQAGQDRRTQMTIDQRNREFDNTQVPIQTPTGPVYSRRSEAIGQPAVASLADVKGGFAQQSVNNGGLGNLNPTERQFVGAAEHGGTTPRMWVNPDGSRHMTVDNRTDNLTGEALVPGGGLVNIQGDPNSVGLRPSVQGKLQESNIANERLKRLGSYAQSLVSPQNVGATGAVKGIAQDAAQLAQNLATGLGYTGLSDAIGDLQKRAQATGVGQSLPGLFTFDPTLPKVETAYDMLVMSAADAFAGGMGRASDRDIKIMKSVVGDPRSLFASPESLSAKMAAINDIIGLNQGVNADQLRGGDAPQAPAAPAPGVAPSPAAAPGAPSPDPLADARAAIARGADPNAVRQRLQQHGINPAGL